MKILLIVSYANIRQMTDEANNDDSNESDSHNLTSRVIASQMFVSLRCASGRHPRCVREYSWQLSVVQAGTITVKVKVSGQSLLMRRSIQMRYIVISCWKNPLVQSTKRELKIDKNKLIILCLCLYGHVYYMFFVSVESAYFTLGCQ